MESTIEYNLSNENIISKYLDQAPKINSNNFIGKRIENIINTKTNDNSNEYLIKYFDKNSNLISESNIFYIKSKY
jgi:hypothetical protein